MRKIFEYQISCFKKLVSLLSKVSKLALQNDYIEMQLIENSHSITLTQEVSTKVFEKLIQDQGNFQTNFN